MKRITDKDFRYTPSHATDIKKTFARLERERKDKEKAEREHQVTSIFKSRRQA